MSFISYRLRFASFALLLFLLSGCSDSGSGSDSGITPLPQPVGNPIFERYQPLGQDQAIILDTHTWLAWERCALGQQWDNKDQICIGPEHTLTWGQARVISDNAFELPTLEQLSSLVYCPSEHALPEQIGQRDFSEPCLWTDPRPTIHPQAFPDTPERTFWSQDESTTEGFSLGMNFAAGAISDLNRPNVRYPVRLVRDASELKPNDPETDPQPSHE